MESSEHVNKTVELALRGRYALYQALWATLGGEPGPALVEALAGDELTQLAIALGDEPCAVAAVALRDHARSLLDQGDEAVAALSTAYNRLFVGPGAPEAAPWESVYTSSDGTLFGPVTLDVRKFYVAHGFIPQGYPNVSDDHVGLELDFLRLLGGQAIEAAARLDAAAACEAIEASAAFLKEHVTRWAPRFSQRLAAAPHGALYREAAAFLAAFVPCDARLLDELLVELRTGTVVA